MIFFTRDHLQSAYMIYEIFTDLTVDKGYAKIILTRPTCNKYQSTGGPLLMSLNSLMYCLLAALASHHQVTICINIWVMGRQRMAVEEEGNLGVILRASKSFSLKIQIDNCFGKKSPPIHHNGFLNTSATHFQMLLKPCIWWWRDFE